MTLIAGIGCSQLRCQLRLRYPKTVVMPIVYDHEGLDRHMAIDTGRPAAAFFMVMVRAGIEMPAVMALGAQAVVLCPKPVAVRIMAIGAHDAGLEHFALQERAVNVYFLVDLSIRVIQVSLQQAQVKGIVERSARMVFLEFTAPGMASSTHFNLALRALFIETRQGIGWRIWGSPWPTIGQVESKSGISGLSNWAVIQNRGPFQVCFGRPVTGLTGDVDLRPSSSVTVGTAVVVFTQPG